MAQSLEDSGVIVVRSLDGIPAVDRATIEAVTAPPWKQVKMKVGDRIAMDLVVEFLRTEARVESRGHTVNVIPKGPSLRVGQFERLSDVPLGHQAHIARKGSTRRQSHPYAL
jgi:hypothetical protein